MNEECLKLLTTENIRFIAKIVSDECIKDPDNLTVKELKKSIKEVDQAIENLWRAIEQGQAVDMLTARITQRQEKKQQLEEQLAIEENKRLCLTEQHILAFLEYIMRMPSTDISKRKVIINIFVSAVYLYDDHFTIVFNASNHALREEDIPLEDIEGTLEGEEQNMEGCSPLATPAPPFF